MSKLWPAQHARRVHSGDVEHNPPLSRRALLASVAILPVVCNTTIVSESAQVLMV
jgi:hypothetical protein